MNLVPQVVQTVTKTLWCMLNSSSKAPEFKLSSSWKFGPKPPEMNAGKVNDDVRNPTNCNNSVNAADKVTCEA
ncbi:hypothetical protein PHMEG_00010922 [Phytophthora megakarya]|uniref:Uncharacterized protein n=1 Tax=Phytophthora megakarya TaxID=4795 RepID=A0A225WE63_9STRA|nr:hypothetical protein PHMEG_00010922 [Phytophthora megakarya]